MTHENIRTWLELPPGPWPPDHYHLLGLEPGESNPDRIEQRVHERMETVRRYQLPHPEEATEAMNRLAQAFVCLTDPQAKRTYDAEHFPELKPESTAQATPAAAESSEPAPLAWLFGGAPEVADQPATAVVLDWPPEAKLAETPPTAQHASDTPPTAEAPRPDPVVEAATQSPAARGGLGTKRALYRRLVHTRTLARSWERIGKYLNNPRRKLSRPAEATEVIREMGAVRDLLQHYPAMFGRAGQPGYLVVALSRQQVIVPMLQTLLPSQRDSLARDWQAGDQFLKEHREFLRRELRALRKKSPFGRGLRAIRTYLNEEPGALLLLVALFAIAIALWRTYLPEVWLNPAGGAPENVRPDVP